MLSFSLLKSFQEPVKTFFLLNSDLNPATSFGRPLIVGLNLLGGATMVSCVYLVFRPLIIKPTTNSIEDMERARMLVEKLCKKLIPRGEIALINLESWTLAGGSKRGLRSGII